MLSEALNRERWSEVNALFAKTTPHSTKTTIQQSTAANLQIRPFLPNKKKNTKKDTKFTEFKRCRETKHCLENRRWLSKAEDAAETVVTAYNGRRRGGGSCDRRKTKTKRTRISWCIRTYTIQREDETLDGDDPILPFPTPTPTPTPTRPILHIELISFSFVHLSIDISQEASPWAT